MPIANFEYPINLYNENMSIEDWLANFSVEVSTVHIEILPPETTNPTTVIANVTFLPTLIGEQSITRDMLVAMFSQAEVQREELEAGIFYLENPEGR